MYPTDPLPDLRLWQGRTKELNQIHQWFRDPSVSIIGIGGIGGIGKSTLAAKAFVAVKGFRGKCWIDLTRETSPNEVMKRSLRAFGMSPDQVENLDELDERHLLRDHIHHLQKHPYLLALDNLESWLNPDGTWRTPGIENFLTHFRYSDSRSLILLTSREYPSAYFGMRYAKWLTLENGLSAVQGAALLRSLGVQGSKKELQSASVSVLNYPLALSLIADSIRNCHTHNPSIEYLNEKRTLLDKFQISGQHRVSDDQSIGQILNQSFNRLLPPAMEQVQVQVQVLFRLTVLQRDFRAEALGYMAERLGLPSGDPRSWEKYARDLARRGLLQELPNSGPASPKKFRLPPLLRAFLLERLLDDERQAAHRGAREYYQAIAQPDGWTTLDDLTENLKIFHHSYKLGEYTQAFNEFWNENRDRSCDAFLESRGYHSIRIRLYEKLRTPLEQQWRYKLDQQWQNRRFPDDCLSYATMLNCLGTSYQALSWYQGADNCHANSRVICQEIRARWYQLPEFTKAQSDKINVIDAEAMLGLGNVRYSQREYNIAETFYNSALPLFELSQAVFGNRRATGIANLATAWNALGKAYCELGNYKKALDRHQNALDYLQKALQIDELLNARSVKEDAYTGLGVAHTGLGVAHWDSKSYGNAAYHLARALQIRKELRDRDGAAEIYYHFGKLFFFLKSYGLASRFYREAESIFQEIGDNIRARESKSRAREAESFRVDFLPPPRVFAFFLPILLSFAGSLILSYLFVRAGMQQRYQVSPSVVLPPVFVPAAVPGAFPAPVPVGSPDLTTTSYEGPSSRWVVCPRDRPTSDGLNLRQSPRLSAPVISVIPCGRGGIQILGAGIQADGEWWIPVQYQTIRGWVASRFLHAKIKVEN